MARYQVLGKLTLSIDRVVEADSAEEAEQIVQAMGSDAPDFMSEEIIVDDIVELDSD